MSVPVNCRGKTLKELRSIATINYQDKPVDGVSSKLPNLLKKAEEALSRGNEEEAYIFYMRWQDAANWLKSKKRSINSNQMISVKEKLLTLSNNIKKKSQILEQKVLDTKDDINEMDVDILVLPETPTDDPMGAEADDFIYCKQLYQLIQGESERYLIIDIRPKSDYEKSSMRTSQCVNIPEEEIIRGKTPSYFSDYLYKKDKKSYDLFYHRGSNYVDIVILLDWNTKKESLTSSSRLSILKDILLKWDHGIRYKRIAILDGGYVEWLTRYPTCTTNANVSVPQVEDVEDDTLDNLEYPKWIEIEEENNKKLQTKTSSLKFLQKREYAVKDVPDNRQLYTNGESRITDITTTHLNNNIDTISKDVNTTTHQFGNNDSVIQHKKAIGTIPHNGTITKPIVDRSSKPVTNKIGRTVLDLMRQLNQSGRELEEVEEEIYNTEKALYMQTIENTDPNEISSIRTDLNALSNKQNLLKKTYRNNEEELSKYKEGKEITFSTEEEKEKQEFTLTDHSIKKRLNDIREHRKRLAERSMEIEQEGLSLKNQKDTHMEPLKSDGSLSSSLERSHSSPNLLQIKDRKAPQVDRSSKPQISSHILNGHINDNINRIQRIDWAGPDERLAPIYGNVPPGTTGLKNVGNSCYMNSIIQCLSNTPNLSKYFTDNLYAEDLNKNQENVSQIQIVPNVAEVIKALWAGHYKRITPLCLKAAIGQYKLQFSTYEQQDSHEFLTFLLEWMHNELKKNSKIRTKMSAAEKEWDKAMNSQESIISNLFFGQLRSTITCCSCRKDSITYETFSSLTVPLPQSKCTLNDCIEKFVTGQKVVGWKCPQCQVPREATKKFDFIKLAPIIVIHLSRFTDTGGWFEKRNTAVEFPLIDFNLRRYLVTDSDTSVNNTRYFNYSLYAMSNHYGTMDGGHYTAYCKNSMQNKWYKYDDHTVTEVSPNQVKSQTTSAYLLFYTSLPNTYI